MNIRKINVSSGNKLLGSQYTYEVDQILNPYRRSMVITDYEIDKIKQQEYKISKALQEEIDREIIKSILISYDKA